MKRFIIIGLGTFGSGVAETLFEQGNEVIAVDLNEDNVDRIAARVTRAVAGDARDLRLLEKIGARDADAGIVSTGGDISACVLATMALRDLDVGELYVKVISNDHARIMKKIGVTETIFPERESSINLAVRVSHSNALLNYVRLGSGFSLQEMAVPNNWTGRSLRELQLRSRYGVAVIAIHDVILDQMIPVPDPDAPLKDSDTILVAGANENLARITRID
jgi:trk system potassium uptake protein TrkA